MGGGRVEQPPPLPTYFFLQTSRRSGAGERDAVELATLVDDGAHVLRTNRLNRTRDLVDVLTEVAIQVAIVIAEVCPLKLTHGELRSELEGSLSNILFGDEAFEGFSSDYKHDFVRSGHPSRIAALSEPVRDGSRDNRIDKDEIATAIKTSSAEGLLVDTKSEAAITHELIARDGFLTKLERTTSQSDQIFLDVGVIAEVFDLICGGHDLEELTFASSERFSKHLFAEEGSNAIEGLEVHRRIGKEGRELGVDLLHITSKALRESLGAIDNILDAGLNEILIADISVDKLKDRFFERNLSLEVGTFEGGASLLDANAGTSTTEGLELELILSRTNLVGSSTNATEGSVVHEGRSGERSSGNRHFLNHATNNVGDIRESSTIDGVNVG